MDFVKRRPLKTDFLICMPVQISRHERRLSQIEALNDMALYPTEQILWDENIVPSQYYSGQGMCKKIIFS
jgi:intron-binding protein aquarius